MDRRKPMLCGSQANAARTSRGWHDPYRDEQLFGDEDEAVNFNMGVVKNDQAIWRDLQ